MRGFSTLAFAAIIVNSLLHITATIIRYGSRSYADFSISLEGLADTGSVLKSFDLKTKRGCVLECVSLDTCRSLNFKKVGGNCELLGRTFENSRLHLNARVGWMYMTTNDMEKDVGQACKFLSPCLNNGNCMDIEASPGFKCTCGSLHSGKYCENDRAFASCKAVYDAGFRSDGVYKLENMGYHYCVLTPLEECNTGGWTLIVKTDGSKTTFNYASSYWTSNEVYNQIYALNEGLGGQEAKFDAYNKLTFTKICIALRQSSTTRSLPFYKGGTSMTNLMAQGFTRTYQSQSKWLRLVSGSYLQPNCNRQGINNYYDSTRKVRFGIFTNEQNDCLSIDSFIGIGIGGHAIKTGAVYVLEPYVNIATKGFVLVQ